ncbi:MAG: hypothetical protein INR71_05365 [Terriglobus roseus]|nr:hypothetical protein [Terriglobus roseus]
MYVFIRGVTVDRAIGNCDVAGTSNAERPIVVASCEQSRRGYPRFALLDALWKVALQDHAPPLISSTATQNI